MLWRICDPSKFGSTLLFKGGWGSRMIIRPICFCLFENYVDKGPMIILNYPNTFCVPAQRCSVLSSSQGWSYHGNDWISPPRVESSFVWNKVQTEQEVRVSRTQNWGKNLSARCHVCSADGEGCELSIQTLNHPLGEFGIWKPEM